MKNLFISLFILFSSFISTSTNCLIAEPNQSNEASRLKQGDLKRDYFKYYEDHLAAGYCQTHLLKNQQDWDNDIVFDKEVNRLFHLIPLIEHSCQERYCCQENTIYIGYFDLCISRYFYHFHHYLTNYCSKQTNCHCYWPELSPLAAKINNFAYDLFEDLFYSTILFKKEFHKNGFCEYEGDIEAPIITTEDHDYNEEYFDSGCGFGCDDLERFFPAVHKQGFHDTAIVASFICHSFHYSDYLDVCRDLYSYCKRIYPEEDCVEIKNKMDDLLEKLASPFLELYDHCLAKHPNEHIEKERLIVLSRLGLLDYSFFTALRSNNSHTLNVKIDFNKEIKNRFLNENEILNDENLSFFLDWLGEDHYYKKPNPISLEAEFLLAQGTILNSLLLHKEAIEALTKSIQLDPYDKRTLTERAMAYFETNQIGLALNDYESIKRLTLPPFKDGNHLILNAGIYIPENKIDFAEGLVLGIISGGKIGIQDFIPSLLQFSARSPKCFLGHAHITN